MANADERAGGVNHPRLPLPIFEEKIEELVSRIESCRKNAHVQHDALTTVEQGRLADRLLRIAAEPRPLPSEGLEPPL